MDLNAETIQSAAFALPEEEQLQLAERLIEHVYGAADPAIEQAWREEITRRMGDVDSGRVQPLDGRAALAKLRAELDA